MRYLSLKLPIYFLLIIIPFVLTTQGINILTVIISFAVAGIVTILEIFIRRLD